MFNHKCNRQLKLNMMQGLLTSTVTSTALPSEKAWRTPIGRVCLKNGVIPKNQSHDFSLAFKASKPVKIIFIRIT